MTSICLIVAKVKWIYLVKTIDEVIDYVIEVNVIIVVE